VRRLAAVLLAALASSAHAQSLPWDVTGSLGLVYRNLEERTTFGATLLTETGAMAQLVLQATRPLPSGAAIGGRLLLLGGDLDYQGQTQAGAPLATTTRQSEAGLDLLWRPLAPADWGEAWVTLGWLGNRRAIRGTAIAGGLDERSLAAMAGLLWRSPTLGTIASWQVRAELEGRVSLRHRLYVDYLGLLDESRFDGARKRQFGVRVLGAAAGSPWEWGVEVISLSQGASRAAPVTRGGAPFGIVRQPALTQMDVGLRLSRRF
jgi:hypothetical protein